MDVDLTRAATWSDEYYDQIHTYLSTLEDLSLLKQLEEWREGGQAKLDEWEKIEDAAAKTPSDQLAQVGRGTHLLEGEDAPIRKQSSSKATAEDSE